MPFLLTLSVGRAINKAKAVVETGFGHESAFVRTPKYGVDTGPDRKQVSALKKTGYKAIKSFVVPVLELACGTFFLTMILSMVDKGAYVPAVLMIPFLGFYYTCFCSIGRMISNLGHKSSPQSEEA